MNYAKCQVSRKGVAYLTHALDDGKPHNLKLVLSKMPDKLDTDGSNIVAFTIGGTARLSPENKDRTIAALAQTLCHEWVHRRFNDRFGTVGSLLMSLWQTLRHGYHGGDIEADTRKLTAVHWRSFVPAAELLHSAGFFE